MKIMNRNRFIEFEKKLFQGNFCWKNYTPEDIKMKELKFCL